MPQGGKAAPCYGDSGKLYFYHTKSMKLPGSNYLELRGQAIRFYKELEKQTKRQTYIRSAYFSKEKIFLTYFWKHLWQKSPKERVKRLPYFKAAVELIKYSKVKPMIRTNPNIKNEKFYRFSGVTADKAKFHVQIKENNAGKKYFMSCFPGK